MRSSHTISLRRATLADEDQLRDMQTRSLQELGIKAYDRDSINAFIRRVGTMDNSMLVDGTFFVFEVAGSIVACGGWSADAPNYDEFIEAGHDKEGERFATIRSIYVDPEFAGMGLGKAVMTAVESDIARAGFVQARLAATLNGLPFYQRLGYRPEKPIRLALPGGHAFHGVAMRKAIDNSQQMAA